jgi:TolB-like protein
VTTPLKLTTLGALDVGDSSGARVDQVVAQQKRLALLVYLAVEGVQGPVARDMVCSVFWPESDQKRARANLRNALHFLRGAIGSEAIVTIGDERIQLDSDLVQCDSAEAFRMGVRPEGAVFLAGVHVRGVGADFYDWVDRVRTKLEALPAAPAQPNAVSRAAGSQDGRDGGARPVAPATAGGPEHGDAQPPRWRGVAVIGGLMLAGYVGFGQVGERELIGDIDRSERALLFPFVTDSASEAAEEVADLGSGWVARRVAASGVATVVDYRTLQTQLGDPADVDLAEAADRAFTEFLVLGRSRVTNDTVVVEPRIVRASDLSEIPLPPVTAPLDQSVEAFDEAAERIVAALAAELSPTWRWPPFSPPPSLAILRLEKEAQDAFYVRDYDLFHDLADSAMATDTTYLSFPMLNLKASAYWNQRTVDPDNFFRSDSAIAYLEGLVGRLSPHERRGVQWMRAIVSGDPVAEFEAVDPASGAADAVPYRLAMSSRRTNRLALARELIVKRYLMHPRGANYVAWDQVHLATLARLRDYEALRVAAVDARGREPQYGLFVLREAQALAGLDRAPDMNDIVSLGRAQPVSTEFNPAVHLASAATVAWAEGHEDSARRYAARALAVASEPWSAGVDLSLPMAEARGVLGDWEAAVEVLADVVDEAAPAEIRMDRLGMYGAALAAAGRHEDVVEVLATLNGIALEYGALYLFGVAQWHQARIHARLGNTDLAIRLLSTALERGQVHGPWEIWDIHWLQLRDDPRYQELTRIRF